MDLQITEIHVIDIVKQFHKITGNFKHFYNE